MIYVKSVLFGTGAAIVVAILWILAVFVLPIVVPFALSRVTGAGGTAAHQSTADRFSPRRSWDLSPASTGSFAGSQDARETSADLREAKIPSRVQFWHLDAGPQRVHRRPDRIST